MKTAQNKGVNQTRNNRIVVFISGLFPRWLRMALAEKI
jgi:hypothetical protein